MRQVRFTTPVEVTVDVPDADNNGIDLTDDDRAIEHAAGRANSYLQTLIGEHGLRVDHLGMDALQNAEISAPEPSAQIHEFGVDLPDKQIEVLLSLHYGTRYVQRNAQREDIDPLRVGGLVEQTDDGLTLTAAGHATIEQILTTMRATNPKGAAFMEGLYGGFPR
jgi:hypothetical protein